MTQSTKSKAATMKSTKDKAPKSTKSTAPRSTKHQMAGPPQMSTADRGTLERAKAHGRLTKKEMAQLTKLLMTRETKK